MVEAQRRIYMFYASDDDRGPTIQTATSEDGVFWHRQGMALTGSGEDVDTLGVRSPCVLRLHDGALRLWYAGRPPGNVEAAYRLCSADFTGKDEWLAAV